VLYCRICNRRGISVSMTKVSEALDAAPEALDTPQVARQSSAGTARRRNGFAVLASDYLFCATAQMRTKFASLIESISLCPGAYIIKYCLACARHPLLSYVTCSPFRACAKYTTIKGPFVALVVGRACC
jgi:hypothetical protein